MEGVGNMTEETFQSTPLMRGETRLKSKLIDVMPFQSTPLMRGETIGAARVRGQLAISIHSPLARGDIEKAVRLVQTRLFQSTPLLRGETGAGKCKR